MKHRDYATSTLTWLGSPWWLQPITGLQVRKDRCCGPSNRKRKVLWSKYNIERQGQELYNKAIFVKFQRELQDTTALQTEVIEKDELFQVFVDENQPLQPHRVRKYLVLVNLQEKEYSCICGKFNKDGILCSHILKIMLELKIKEIPEKYIIDRWRKNEKKMSKEVPVLTQADSSTLRFNNLSRWLVTIASKGSKKKRQYEYMFEISKVLEDQMDMVADLGGEQINIQVLSQLSQRLLTLATKSCKTESKFGYLLEATKIMEDEIQSLEEEDVQFQLQNEVNTSTSITNGVIHGQENNSTNSIQNPERVKSKGRQKKEEEVPNNSRSSKREGKKEEISHNNKEEISSAKEEEKGYNKTR